MGCWVKTAPFCALQVVAGTKELVLCTVMGVREAVSGAVGMAYGAVRGGVERTQRMLSCSIGTVVGTQLGQLLANGTDTVLEKSEELMEHYLPGMDGGPGECLQHCAEPSPSF